MITLTTYQKRFWFKSFIQYGLLHFFSSPLHQSRRLRGESAHEWQKNLSSVDVSNIPWGCSKDGKYCLRESKVAIRGGGTYSLSCPCFILPSFLPWKVWELKIYIKFCSPSSQWHSPWRKISASMTCFVTNFLGRSSPLDLSVLPAKLQKVFEIILTKPSVTSALSKLRSFEDQIILH